MTPSNKTIGVYWHELKSLRLTGPSKPVLVVPGVRRCVTCGLPTDNPIGACPASNQCSQR